MARAYRSSYSFRKEAGFRGEGGVAPPAQETSGLLRTAIFVFYPDGRTEPQAGHRWEVPMAVQTATLDAEGPAVLRLTVNGVDTSTSLRVGIYGGQRTRPAPLVLAAGDAVGIRVESGSVEGALSLELRPAVHRLERPAPMLVRWVHGPERLDLYSYTPATRVFTALRPSLLPGRATITSDATHTTVVVRGREEMRVEDGATRVRALAPAPTRSGGPRIEFWTMEHVVATLGPTGLGVRTMSDTVPDPFQAPAAHYAFPAAPATPAMTIGPAGVLLSTLRQDL